METVRLINAYFVIEQLCRIWMIDENGWMARNNVDESTFNDFVFLDIVRPGVFKEWAGADLGGGCRGCAPPPWEMVFCKKKKTMWFIGVEVEQETSAPSPKKILDPPLSGSFNFKAYVKTKGFGLSSIDSTVFKMIKWNVNKWLTLYKMNQVEKKLSPSCDPWMGCYPLSCCWFGLRLARRVWVHWKSSSPS